MRRIRTATCTHPGCKNRVRADASNPERRCWRHKVSTEVAEPREGTKVVHILNTITNAMDAGRMPVTLSKEPW
ncbi:MAG: hypothetical protein AAFR68_16600 [Pseudomonadota bacterium]